MSYHFHSLLSLSLSLSLSLLISEGWVFSLIIYSPREMTRWVHGIYEGLKPLKSLLVEGLVRVWTHEALWLLPRPVSGCGYSHLIVM